MAHHKNNQMAMECLQDQQYRDFSVFKYIYNETQYKHKTSHLDNIRVCIYIYNEAQYKHKTSHLDNIRDGCLGVPAAHVCLQRMQLSGLRIHVWYTYMYTIYITHRYGLSRSVCSTCVPAAHVSLQHMCVCNTSVSAAHVCLQHMCVCAHVCLQHIHIYSNHRAANTPR